VTEAAPDWFQTEYITRDRVLPEEIWDAVLDAVDGKCKAEECEEEAGCRFEGNAPCLS